MKYRIEFMQTAIKDLKSIQRTQVCKIMDKIEEMSYDLKGDRKKLIGGKSEYRLRIGNYRILFEIKKDTILIYRIKHRKESYK